MKFISTNGRAGEVTFMEAMRNGLAPDGGLYMPQSFPRLKESFWKKLSNLTFAEIAFDMSRHFISNELPNDRLEAVITESFNFPIKLHQIEEKNFVMELFHGPTLAFKDFGARFMARLFSEQAQEKANIITILVATSGDTGSAVANGFHNVEGVNVCILYPKGKVSPLQEMQMTTLGGNITVFEVDGVFDDCQRLVKQAFLDEDLTSKMQLSSANSINIARLLPQSFYYAYAAGRVRELGSDKVRFSVPSGNFGNLTGGLFAQKMGLKVEKFIAATNRNNVVPLYLKGAAFKPRPSVQTISNAMDVGNPSNFVRIQHLFNYSDDKIRSGITGFNYSDDETRAGILKVYKNNDYLMCPHTSVGYRAAKDSESEIDSDTATVILGTAHPVKFRDNIEPLIQKSIGIPERLKDALERKKLTQEISAEYKSLKNKLLQLF